MASCLLSSAPFMANTVFIGANVDCMSALRVERTLLSAAFAVAFDFDFSCDHVDAADRVSPQRIRPPRGKRQATGAAKGQHQSQRG
jgi:hypothetical protein